MTGATVLNLPPTSSTGRLPGGGDLWAESVDNQKEETGRQSLVLRLVGVIETALTGEGELEESCLWRTVAVARPAIHAWTKERPGGILCFFLGEGWGI